MADMLRARDRSLILRVQRVILSVASDSSSQKLFLNDSMASILDSLFQMVHLYTKNIEKAEKLGKYIVKTVMKVEMVYRNDGLSEDDLKDLKEKLVKAGKAVLSFHGLEYTYDVQFLVTLLEETHAKLRQVVEKHFMVKSVERLDEVCYFFTNPTFLSAVFKRESEFNEILDKMVQDIKTVFEENRL